MDSIQVPNILGNYLQGREARREVDKQNFMATNAPAIMAGEPNAMAEYARFAPQEAMSMMQQQQQMAMQRQQFEMARASAAREAEAALRAGRAEASEAEAEATRQFVAGALYQQTPEQFDAYVTSNGQPDLVGQYDNRQSLAAMALGSADAIDMWLKQAQPPKPQSPEGKLAADRAAGLAPPEAAPPVSYIVTGEGASKLGLDPANSYNIEVTPGGPKATLIGGGAATSAAEAEIGRLMELGYSRTEAIRIAETHVVSRDPLTGDAIIIDKATGKRVEQPGDDTAPPPAAAPEALPGPRLIPAANQSFGAGGALGAVINTVTDTIGLGPAFPNVQEGQAIFNVLEESLTQDVTSGYGARLPSWFLKAIKDLAPKAGSVFQGPGEAQSKLRALRANFETEAASLASQLASRSMSPTAKQEMEARAVAVETALSRIDMALGSFQTQEQMSPEQQALFDKYYKP